MVIEMGLNVEDLDRPLCRSGLCREIVKNPVPANEMVKGFPLVKAHLIPDKKSSVCDCFNGQTGFKIPEGIPTFPVKTAVNTMGCGGKKQTGNDGTFFYLINL